MKFLSTFWMNFNPVFDKKNLRSYIFNVICLNLPVLQDTSPENWKCSPTRLNKLLFFRLNENEVSSNNVCIKIFYRYYLWCRIKKETSEKNENCTCIYTFEFFNMIYVINVTKHFFCCYIKPTERLSFWK